MAPITAPTPNPPWPLPNFGLIIADLSHPGANIFLNAVDVKEALETATRASYTWLHNEKNPPALIQDLQLILRSMPGVAHATGSHTHKQIHFSLDYIKGISKDRLREEILGVLVHETVHCFQFNGNGTCPGGLVEGVADYVRLKAGYAPPHWRKHGDDRTWDAGYETTAYFLEWIENRYGLGAILELNCCMKEAAYHRRLFKQITGRPVRKLWSFYCAALSGNPEPISAQRAGDDDDDGDDD